MYRWLLFINDIDVAPAKASDVTLPSRFFKDALIVARIDCSNQTQASHNSFIHITVLHLNTTNLCSVWCQIDFLHPFALTVVSVIGRR